MILAAVVIFTSLVVENTPPPREPAWLAETWEAVKNHETMGGKKLVGDGGRAIGPGHTTAQMVRECNRIARLRGLAARFTLADRWSEVRSWEMFRLHSIHHGACDPAGAAKRWNCGADMRPAAKAEAYWRKVQALMRRAA